MPAPYVYLAFLFMAKGRPTDVIAAIETALKLMGPLGPNAADETNDLADRAAGLLVDLGLNAPAADLLRRTASYRKSVSKAFVANATFRNVCD
jgi:hypothetical protein